MRRIGQRGVPAVGQQRPKQIRRGRPGHGPGDQDRAHQRRRCGDPGGRPGCFRGGRGQSSPVPAQRAVCGRGDGHQQRRVFHPARHRSKCCLPRVPRYAYARPERYRQSHRHPGRRKERRGPGHHQPHH